MIAAAVLCTAGLWMVAQVTTKNCDYIQMTAIDAEEAIAEATAKKSNRLIVIPDEPDSPASVPQQQIVVVPDSSGAPNNPVCV